MLSSMSDEELRLVVKNSHRHEPDPGTFVRAKDGIQADILNPADYPVWAVCHVCGEAIWTQAMFVHTDWEATTYRPPTRD
jgi:hypothetical protein